MMVCDICMTPDPEYGGSPLIRRKTSTGEEYLFQHPQTRSTSRVDFCEICVELLRARAWEKVAARAHEVLMLRLGVQSQGLD